MQFREFFHKLNLKYAFYVIIISIVVWLFFLFFLTDNYVDLNSVAQPKEKTIKRNDCNPILENKKQYTINIDGQKYPQIVYLYQNETIDFKCLNRNRETKVIFVQTPTSDHFFGFRFGHIKPFEETGCPVRNCELTKDSSKLNNSDLVLFETGINTYKSIPKYRPSNQRYVFALYESPINSPDFSRYKNFFNLSSTYDEDSDFPGFYSTWKFKWKLNETFDENYDFYGNKRTKFSAAVISNCRDEANRLGYLKELNKHISVDIFGNCGKKCPEFYENTTIRDDCKTIISKEYYFLLSFENSVCKDYITEKFFYILNLNIIPVVRGGGHYERYVPKSGFINALDFKSPQHLGEYLIYLTKNKTAYNSYFKWKKYISFYSQLYPKKGDAYSVVCDMCIKLHLEDFYGIEPKIIKYPHISAYCKSYSPIFKYIYFSLIFFFIAFNFLIVMFYISKK